MSDVVSVDHPAIKKAILTTAKFGFLSKSIFDEQIANGSRVYRWMLWKKLLSLDLFEYHRDNYLKNEIIKFSPRGLTKVVLREEFKSLKTVSAPSMQNISHDEIVMRFVLHNEKENLIYRCIPESYFKKQQLSNYTVFDDGKKKKYPDLIFNLNIQDAKIRVALEVERTRKRSKSYKSFVSAYANIPELDFVIVACVTKGVKKALNEAMTLTKYPRHIRPIAFCRLNELVENPSDFSLEINGVNTTLRKRILDLADQNRRVV